MRLRVAVAGGLFAFRAPRPIDRAFGHEIAEPDIVRPTVTTIIRTRSRRATAAS
jgi:hypothetical protein